MKEKGWLASKDVHAMLAFLRGRRVGFLAVIGWEKQPSVTVSDRSRRLFGVACCRRIERLFRDKRLLPGVEAVEQLIDGHRQREDLEAVFAGAEQVYQETCVPYDPIRYSAAAAAVRELIEWQSIETEYGPGHPEHSVASLTRRVVSNWDRKVDSREQQAQRHLLRDIVGNPFRPSPIELAWVTPMVTGLASAAYEERLLPSGELDPARLAVLADLLEEIGCSDADILGHLRGSGPHVLGCWVIDLLLGRS